MSFPIKSWWLSILLYTSNYTCTRPHQHCIPNAMQKVLNDNIIITRKQFHVDPHKFSYIIKGIYETCNETKSKRLTLSWTISRPAHQRKAPKPTIGTSTAKSWMWKRHQSHQFPTNFVSQSQNKYKKGLSTRLQSE